MAVSDRGTGEVGVFGLWRWRWFSGDDEAVLGRSSCFHGFSGDGGVVVASLQVGLGGCDCC